jgi:hypothetical protein
VVVSWFVDLGEAIVSSINEWRGNLDLSKFLIKRVCVEEIKEIRGVL